MNAPAFPVTLPFHGDASLGGVLAALGPHAARSLGIEHGGQAVRAGFHVTEVKAGSFVTLDCGGNPDAWQETILQVEDLPAPPDAPAPMSVGKFLGILAQVAGKVALDPAARLTFEVGPPGAPMAVHDLAAMRIEAQRVVLELAPRPAICKPRHRAQQAAAAPCCGPAKASCCD